MTKELQELESRDAIGLVLDAMGVLTAVEVGVAFGENAELILLGSNLERLLLVDPWDYVKGEDPQGYGDAIKDWTGCERYARHKMEKFGDRAAFLKMSSAEAANLFEDESVGFVYIDANHKRPYIDRDILAWFPKVRVGGLIGGHDYHNVYMEHYTCEVKQAVDSLFDPTQLHTTKDVDPSWYFHKETSRAPWASAT